jgi:ComF family protein
MLKTLEQWVFGSSCCLCGLSADPAQDFCRVCVELLPWIEDRCFRCALPLEWGLEAVYCERCRTETLPFDRVCALFEYQPPIDRMIACLKFSGQLAYGRILGSLLADQIPKWYKDAGSMPEAILPVPLHPQRLLERGFNQAIELAWVLQKRLGLLLLNQQHCRRIKHTKPQSTLDQSARHRNLKAAFYIKGSLPFESVAIVDDVVTTCSTVRALAERLKEAGVSEVHVWCIARA